VSRPTLHTVGLHTAGRAASQTRSEAPPRGVWRSPRPSSRCAWREGPPPLQPVDRAGAEAEHLRDLRPGQSDLDKPGDEHGRISSTSRRGRGRRPGAVPAGRVLRPGAGPRAGPFPV
jgi:hypothetical protein